MHQPRWFASALTILLAATGTVALAATPAQAALPDVVGFVLWNGSVVASGTRPAATSVTGTTVKTITFPGLAAWGGVVHVTAINDTARWCQVLKFFPSGPDEIVDVACFAPGGAVVVTAFSAIFESSSPPAGPINGRFGYVDTAATGAIISQFNSSGAVNGAGMISSGVYTVKMPALSTAGPTDGSVQATAVNSSVPARCKVYKWSSSPSGQLIQVNCYDATGTPLSTEFTLTYQYQQSLYGAGWPPRFGYLWNMPPAGPVSTNFNSVSGPGANTIAVVGTGLYQVIFKNLAVLPDDVQVTAVGSGSDYCNMVVGWSASGSDTVVKAVACYTNAGVRTPGGFTVSDNSAF
jgi:hypothetical protein